MSQNLTALFSTIQNDGSARNLAGTTQLTNVSTTIAHSIMDTVSNSFEEYRELIAASKCSADSMDKLITTTYDLLTVDVDFLKALDPTILDLMLKSQQSKRSRSKSKIMTMDNYTSMMVASIAECLLRLASGKSKASGGSTRNSSTVEYTAEQLEQLAANQEALRKEIRNIQSKKSIAKSKEGFSEETDRWQQLLVAEAQLKALRTDVKTVTVQDGTKEAFTALLGGVDVHNMKNVDAKKLLEAAAKLLADMSAPASVPQPETEPANDAE